MAVTEKYGLIFDPARCTGCKECEAACVSAHPDDIVQEPRIRISYNPSANGYSATYCVQCNECAPSTVCPPDLISFDRPGLTWILEEERCIACNACIPKCDYHAIFLDPTMGVETAYKCDMCVAAGGPQCVKSCPTQAIAIRTPVPQKIDGRVSD